MGLTGYAAVEIGAGLDIKNENRRDFIGLIRGEPNSFSGEIGNKGGFSL